MKQFTKFRGCPVCRKEFKPSKIGQKVCGPDCAIKYARAAPAYFDQSAKGKRKVNPSLSDERQLTQKVFNNYIRTRDEGVGCISCGETRALMDAGHYRTRAAAPHLAYNVYNVHLQCRQCNTMKSGNLTLYRAALVERIGADKVEWLDNSNERAGYTIEYLQRLRSVFSERARHIVRIRRLNTERGGGF